MSGKYFSVRQSCPACGNSHSKTIYSKNYLSSPVKEFLESFYTSQGIIEFEYLEDTVFQLQECTACGNIYQKEVPNDFLARKLYCEWISPELARRTEVEEKGESFAYKYAREIEMIISFLRKKPAQIKMLDYGMGWGLWCIEANKAGCNCFGTELSEERISHAKSQGVKTISWDEIPGGGFDFINTEQVFEHISNPLKTLLHLKKGLSKAGLIKISVPDGSDIKRRLRIEDWQAPKGSNNSLNPVSPLEHINCFTWSSVLKMAEAAGLEEVKVPLIIQLPHLLTFKTPHGFISCLLTILRRNLLFTEIYVFLRERK